MEKPRLFLGSSTAQANLLDVLTQSVEDVADVEPWTTSFNPGRSTLERLLELTREVDFAAFLFARDDWTAVGSPAAPAADAGQAAPRDNVVFEAGLFGGALGMRRSFILHCNGSKLPTDLLGLTCVRYGDPATAEEMKMVGDKLRGAIETEGRIARVEGLWWQYSLTARTEREPSALGLVRVSRGRDGALEMTGRAWQEDGRLSARYWSEAAKEKRDPSGIFYYWKGERPLHPDAPQLHGTGEIRLESADEASGYFTTLSDMQPDFRARTSGVYLRAGSDEVKVMDGHDDRQRAELIAARLKHWQGIRST